MQFKFKKVLSLCMAIAILSATALAGCSSEGDKVSSTGGSTGGSTGTSSSAGTAAPEGAEKLTIGIQQSANIENFETNLLTTTVEKAMNVDMEFLVLPADANDAKTKVALLVSSGSQLPDVFSMAFADSVAFDYATKGVFIKTTDYLSNPELAKNFNAIPQEDRDFILANSKLPDGEIYSVPGYIPFEWNDGPHRFWVYKPWLEKLNLKAPTTLDEFYTVSKAFAEQDPNGNGKKDEIAIVGSKDGWGQKPFVYIMNAFTYANPDRQYFAVENGKIVPAFTKDEWKQGLEYMAKLVKEELFSPISFTQDQTQMKALIGVEGGMAGFVAAGSYSTFSSSPALKDCYELVAPVAGPNGNQTTAYNPTLPEQPWWITKDCKNPELAFKVGDYFLSEDISMMNRYGEKGVDWTDDPEVCKNWTGIFEETKGLTTKYTSINNIWGVLQNKHWGDGGPTYRSLETAMSEGQFDKTKGLDENATPIFYEDYSLLYPQYFPKEFITKISYTPEETEKLANSKTSIDTYVYDTAVAFITGNKPLTEWDSYIKELENMGLNEYVTITQAAFDRTK